MSSRPLFVVGDRTYRIHNLPFPEQENPWEVDPVTPTMPQAAAKLNAHLGEDDARYILGRWEEIDWETHIGLIFFIFTDWLKPGTKRVAYLYRQFGRGELMHAWDSQNYDSIDRGEDPPTQYRHWILSDAVCGGPAVLERVK